MRCFVCQKPAAFSFRWPWSTVLLAVCTSHTGDVTKKARAQACRVPDLEPLTVPLVAPPALPGNGPGNKSTPSPHAPAQPPPEPPPATSTSVGEGSGRGSVAGPAEDTRPGFKRPAPPQLAHNPPPPAPAPRPELVEAVINGDGAPVAVVTIGKRADGLAFTLRRLGQHDIGGSMAELGVTLVALGLMPAPADEPPPTKPPPRQPGASPGEFSHPGQVTPPGAASALAGAGSGGPPLERGARPPVNPPMGGMGVTPVSPHRHPQAPLGAVSTVSAAPGGQPPTPPPVALPMAAPVAPDASPGGGPEPSSVVE